MMATSSGNSQYQQDQRALTRALQDLTVAIGRGQTPGQAAASVPLLMRVSDAADKKQAHDYFSHKVKEELYARDPARYANPNAPPPPPVNKGYGSAFSSAAGAFGMRGFGPVAAASFSSRFAGQLADSANAQFAENMGLGLNMRRFGENLPVFGNFFRFAPGGQFDREMTSQNLQVDHQYFMLAQAQKQKYFQGEGEQHAVRASVAAAQAKSAASTDFAERVGRMDRGQFVTPYSILGQQTESTGSLRLAAEASQSKMIESRRLADFSRSEVDAERKRVDELKAIRRGEAGAFGNQAQSMELEARSARLKEREEQHRESERRAKEDERAFRMDQLSLGRDKEAIYREQEMQGRSAAQNLFEATPGVRSAMISAAQQALGQGIESLGHHQRPWARAVLGDRYDRMAQDAGDKYFDQVFPGGFKRFQNLANEQGKANVLDGAGINAAIDAQLAKDGEEFGKRISAIIKGHSDAAVQSLRDELETKKRIERAATVAKS